MKNERTQKNANPSPTAITATLRESRLLEEMIEGMAGIRTDAAYDREPVHTGWRSIETSTVDSYAGGDLVLSNDEVLTRVPFVACFLFTCIRKQVEGYDLAWSCSLS